MLDDWKWKWNWGEASFSIDLVDNEGNNIAYITRCDYDVWNCYFNNPAVKDSLSLKLTGIESPEEVIWKSTVWIYDECNRIANSYRHIRDHLPSLHELHEKYEKSKEIKNE